MNGFSSSRAKDGFNGIQPLRPLRPTLAPKGAALVEAYRPTTTESYPREQPRYNSMNNSERVPSSALVDLKDAVQVHLLTETALYDSKEYTILSQEEVDELKKQCQFLNQRIQQTRATLAVQSKYRDAAISMTKLYTPTHVRRPSLLGNRASDGEAAREAEAERDATQKKCEDLAVELWGLEKKLMEPQRRLLQHTAGILQLTHKSKKAPAPLAKTPLVNGVPASPESMYTTSNGRDSMDPEDALLFDEGSLYKSFADVGLADVGLAEAPAPSMPAPMMIPPKSPVREQHKQLAEETEKLREENVQLKQDTEGLRSKSQSLESQAEELRAQAQSLESQAQSLSAELSGMRERDSEQLRLLSDTESKLERVNRQLREVIVAADPETNGSYVEPPSGQGAPGDMIASHLEYLERSLTTVAGSVGGGQGGDPGAVMMVQTLSSRVHGVLSSSNPDYPPPPGIEAALDGQIAYLQDSLDAVEGELRKATELSSKSIESKRNAEQSEAVLMGLWEIIQSGYADIRSRRQDRRKTRAENGLDMDDEDMSDSEAIDTEEKYSLSAFNARVQWLYAQATSLKDQKTVLKRQIKQQRELGNKTDGEKEMALKAKMEESAEAYASLERIEKETEGVRAELSQALVETGNIRGQLAQTQSELQVAQNSANRNGSESSAAIMEVRDQVKERNARIASLETSSQELQARLAAADASIETITAQLRDICEAKAAMEAAVEEKSKQVKAKDDELDEMTGMVAELKMRVTLAEAELDGAYGSRQERAAEMAKVASSSELAKLQAKVDKYQPRVEQLEKELAATMQDLKAVTRQAIDAETKISELESELDSVTQAARREKEELQESLDRERLSSANAPAGGRGKTSILTDSYRDALRAERKKYDEQLRNEQLNRRKIEEELKTLKRAQGISVRSPTPLSPGMLSPRA